MYILYSEEVEKDSMCQGTWPFCKSVSLPCWLLHCLFVRHWLPFAFFFSFCFSMCVQYVPVVCIYDGWMGGWLDGQMRISDWMVGQDWSWCVSFFELHVIEILHWMCDVRDQTAHDLWFDTNQWSLAAHTHQGSVVSWSLEASDLNDGERLQYVSGAVCQVQSHKTKFMKLS